MAKPKTQSSPKIGIVAPSSMIPDIEFQLGVEKMKQEGWSVEVHPCLFGNHLLYSATDEVRAQSFLEFAFRKDLNILWCARGGYGATHLLPILDAATRKKKPPKKTLFGYSDATALMEFARTRWGWKTVHSPMPSFRSFSILPKGEWGSVQAAVQNSSKANLKLEPVFIPKSFKETSAPLVGGNLAVWNSLLGTPYAGKASGKLLLLEEVGENIGRINRMLHQLLQSSGLKNVKAIVLGDFTDCNDTAPLALKELPTPLTESFLKSPPSSAMAPIRTVLSSSEALKQIFKEFGKKTEIAIFKGMPVGHGEHQTAIELGRKYSLSRSGHFRS